MNKLMKNAVVAAVMSFTSMTYGGIDGSAYQIRFNLRTVEGVKVTCTKDSSSCKMCGETEWTENLYYFRPITRNIKGILARCINCGESITNMNNYVFALWDEAYSIRFTTNMSAVVDSKISTYQNIEDYQFKKYGNIEIRQFGSKGQYVSVNGNLDIDNRSEDGLAKIDLAFTGFGDGRTSDGRIGQVSGAVLGNITVRCMATFLNSSSVCVAFDDLCNYQDLLVGTPETYVPAYGQWTLRSVDGARDYATIKELAGNGANLLGAQ